MGRGLALGLLLVGALAVAEGRMALGAAALAVGGLALAADLASRLRSTPARPPGAAEGFRLLIEKAPDFISVLNADGTVRYRSPSFERFLGYPPGVLAGRTTFDFIHPDDRPRVLSAFQELLGDPGGVRLLELRFRLADGSWRALDVVGSNLLHEPSVAGVVINSRDVTERKRAEARQAAQLAVTRVLADSESLADATPKLLAAASQGTGWETGELWVAGEGGRLALAGRWPPGEGPDAADATLAEALASGEPAFDGGALAVPVRSRTGLEGGLVFRGSDHGPPEPDLRSLMVDIGLQLGQFVERTRVQAALRSSEDRFRALVEHSSDAILLIDANGIRTYVGPSTRRIFGFAEETLLGRPFIEDVHPEDRARVAGLFAQALARPGEAIGDECRVRRMDGSWRWVEGVGRNLLATPGVGAVVVNFRDVTDRREADAALRKLSRAVDQTADQVVILDREGRIEYVNLSFEKATGYTSAEVVGRPVGFLRSLEQDPPGLFPEVGAQVLAGQVFSGTFVNRRKDATLYHVETTVTPLRDAQGEITHLLATGRDITERVRLEAEQGRLERDLHKAALEWRLTFDAIESPVLVLDGLGRVARMNAAARVLAGQGDEAERGSDLAALGEAEPWRTSAVLAAQVAASRASRHGQARDAQSGRTWEIAASPLAGPDPHDQRVILVARDVTRTAELQESLRRNETMSAMGRLVAGVAHEVRNPLFAISANLDALELELGEGSPHSRTFAVLHREVDRLGALMHELLEYGRPHGLEVGPAALSDVVSQAIHLTAELAAAGGVAVVDAVPGGLPLVPMDRKRMGQVFHNLLENAIQHTDPGGRVMVAAGVARERGLELLVCSVLDSGSGFGEQDLPRVFEPFFTRRRGGTGLGLSIVARIVEEHGGRVTAANRPEGGAVLSVKLPLRRGEAAATA